MELRFENNKSGNGGYITLKNETEDVGRLTYTIVPELNCQLRDGFSKIRRARSWKKISRKICRICQKKWLDNKSALLLRTRCSQQKTGC